jgi:carbonic anhydrase/acetyltransferase-like protein (isoleucine patch superfamily)
VFLGEGALVPTGTMLPSDVVAVGRPARVIRTVSAADLERLRSLRDGDLSIPPQTWASLGPTEESNSMQQLYAYRGIVPTIAESAVLFTTAEITGDVVIGERSIIGAGVKIIGDSHGPVRILENTVLHLLPDNHLVIDDGATVGPGAMIHGCHVGARSVVEPGAIVCDGSSVGDDCVVRAGAVVKQRSTFPDGVEIDGFPAVAVGRVDPPQRPAWALDRDDLPVAHR